MRFFFIIIIDINNVTSHSYYIFIDVRGLIIITTKL